MALQQFVLTLGLFVLIAFILIVGREILIPLVIAIFLWYLINALAEAFKHFLPLPKILAFVLAILTMVTVVWFPINLITDMVPKVVEAAPLYQENLQKVTQKWFEYFEIEEGAVSTALREKFNLTKVISYFAAGLASFGGRLVLVLLYVAFLLAEQGNFAKKISAAFTKAKNRKTVNKVINNIYKKVQTYLWVKTVVSLATGLLSYTVLFFVGVDFAAFWGVIIFFLNFIPNIGSILGVIFPAILTLVQFDSLYPFFIVVFGVGFIQFMIGSVTEPRLMGSSLNLSPLIIILSLVFWGSIWGIVGAFLSVPITVTIMIVLAQFENTKGLAVMLSSDGKIE